MQKVYECKTVYIWVSTCMYVTSGCTKIVKLVCLLPRLALTFSLWSTLTKTEPNVLDWHSSHRYVSKVSQSKVAHLNFTYKWIQHVSVPIHLGIRQLWCRIILGVGRYPELRFQNRYLGRKGWISVSLPLTWIRSLYMDVYRDISEISLLLKAGNNHITTLHAIKCSSESSRSCS